MSLCSVVVVECDPNCAMCEATGPNKCDAGVYCKQGYGYMPASQTCARKYDSCSLFYFNCVEIGNMLTGDYMRASY